MRKKKHEDHENYERWLISYADFITLMFAFFVVMYALSAINEDKYRVLAEALAAAFHNEPRTLQPIQLGAPVNSDEKRVLDRPSPPMGQVVSLPDKPLKDERRQGGADGEGAVQEIARRVEQAFAPLIKRGLVTVRRFEYWLEVEIRSHLLFASGSAVLDEGALPVLREVAAILREYPNPVHVEGYTDSLPIKTDAFPSNWELSVGRATSVVHLLLAEGIDPHRLAAIGYGEYRPSASNDTEEGRQQNRKVVFVVLADLKMQRMRDLTESATERPVPPPLPPPSASTSERLSGASTDG